MSVLSTLSSHWMKKAQHSSTSYWEENEFYPSWNRSSLYKELEAEKHDFPKCYQQCKFCKGFWIRSQLPVDTVNVVLIRLSVPCPRDPPSYEHLMTSMKEQSHWGKRNIWLSSLAQLIKMSENRGTPTFTLWPLPSSISNQKHSFSAG